MSRRLFVSRRLLVSRHFVVGPGLLIGPRLLLIRRLFVGPHPSATTLATRRGASSASRRATVEAPPPAR